MNVHFALSMATAAIPVANKLVIGREEAGASLPASHQRSSGRVGFIPLCSYFFTRTYSLGAQNILGNARLPLNIRKHFFTVKVTRHWHRVPIDMVESLSLEIFKSQLGMVLDSLLQVSLADLQKPPPTLSLQWFCGSVSIRAKFQRPYSHGWQEWWHWL